ncbi:MAG: glutamate-5-semialdehyde dehydrogenase [Verrucomicrobiales bacterium]|nr:glutamate-5-semialdehyde dehydrogenase [Verrucomicrobiales bacterium]
MSLTEQMSELASGSKKASRLLTRISTDDKNACLMAMASAIEDNSSTIQQANTIDMAAGREMGLSQAMLDRLLLTDERIAGMAAGLREVAELSDPVGRVLEKRERPNGLILRKVTTPIGVVVIIYESRPNVTADAAGLCFKSGNATILRGGKEALNSNQTIARLMVEAGQTTSADFPAESIQVVPTTDRAAIPELLAQTSHVDLCIPRGGEGLIRAVAECSRVPVIKHYKGICSVYIDSKADPQMAMDIAVNSKTHRPGVCNAMETLLIDKSAAQNLLPPLAAALTNKGVELRADEAACRIIGNGCKIASPEDWDTEYLDLVCAIRTVDGLDGAIEHINQHGSGHTDAIVTDDENAAARFQNEIDSSTVFWNASTRFTDGGQFGMGAEIGISTDKIGARGPMGLAELTSYKWLGMADGLIRE